MRLRTREIGSSSDAKGKGKAKYQESSEEEEEEEYVPVVSDSDYEVGEEILDAHEENGEREAIEVSDNEQDIVPTKRRKRRSSKRKREQSGIIHDELGEEDERGVEEDADAEIHDAFMDNDALVEKPVKKKGKKKKADKPVLMWEVLEQENNRWVTENLEKDLDLVNQNEMIAETAEAPADLIIPLLRYQKEWLAWALKQENSVARGGILADEMGMGKTLQAIALVLLKRSIPREICGSSSATSSNILPSIKGTLVICPVVAAMQWVGEIEKFTLEGSTKVLVYHGSNRAKKHYQFSEYDFVITTYSIVEAEYRKYILPPKEKCQYCGKSFQGHKLKIHLKYYCGPDAMRTFKQSKQVKKQSHMKELVNPESSTKTTSARKGKKHKNADKDVNGDNEHESFEGKSILHSLMWERIILDEAHYIKERRSSTTRSIFALQSSYKWALSGTPLQNRVGELYSLVRFLQIYPYSFYFCKDCDCSVLDYSTTADCPGCAHKGVRHFCWWNRNIATPIQDSGHAERGRAAMLLLKHKVLKSIVLRRTKKGRAADLALPPRVVTLRRDSLDVVEEDFYTALYKNTQSQFNTYIEQGTVLNNYAHIFDLLTRLRQAVDHPYLVEYSLLSVEKKSSKLLSEEVGKTICNLCNEAEDIVVTSCGHIYCKSCLIDYGVMRGQNICPECSKPLTVDFSTNIDVKKDLPKTTLKGFRPSSILNRIVLPDFQTSTKIDALREEIRFMIENDGSAKGIVFSQFSSFLDLIHYSLEKCGVACVKLDGSMSMTAREVAIKRFTNDSSCKIFLMSLKAGGVALNLTVASHVFLMDPWWNPAVERQAQDRIHRIGQYKSIQIVRFIIVNTIEERILKLQEKKELVFEGTIGGSSEAFSKLTEADLRFLFN